jgi:hypothetical protein
MSNMSKARATGSSEVSLERGGEVLLDAATGKEVRRFNMQEHVGEYLAFSPDAGLVASAVQALTRQA